VLCQVKSAVRQVRAPATVATDGTATLVISAEVLAELRLALLADLGWVGDELLAMIGEIESPAMGDGVDAAEMARRWRVAAAEIQTRRELHELAGWPGEPLGQRTLTGSERCALAARLLSERRDMQLARVTRGCHESGERSAASETASLLDTFLNSARTVMGRPGSSSAGQSASGGQS
jgi:hypothetical protein